MVVTSSALPENSQVWQIGRSPVHLIFLFTRSVNARLSLRVWGRTSIGTLYKHAVHMVLSLILWGRSCCVSRELATRGLLALYDQPGVVIRNDKCDATVPIGGLARIPPKSG
jgi:hypothetical protein